MCGLGFSFRGQISVVQLASNSCLSFLISGLQVSHHAQAEVTFEGGWEVHRYFQHRRQDGPKRTAWGVVTVATVCPG